MLTRQLSDGFLDVWETENYNRNNRIKPHPSSTIYFLITKLIFSIFAPQNKMFIFLFGFIYLFGTLVVNFRERIMWKVKLNVRSMKSCFESLITFNLPLSMYCALERNWFGVSHHLHILLIKRLMTTSRVNLDFSPDPTR